MTETFAAPFIHIVPGLAAAGCLRQALSIDEDSLLINYDILSCGPLRPLDTLDNWTRLRQEYLLSSGADVTFTFGDQDHDLLSHADRLQRAPRITLWIGTGLAEQLLLTWVVELLEHLAIDSATLLVVQFDQVDRFEVVGLGVLNPTQLEQHPDAVTLDAVALREARAAWAAVTAAEPSALLSFLTAERCSLPLLPRSLFGLLGRYPSSANGLNDWEYQLLRYTREVGPRAVSVLAHTMAHDMDYPDWVGDDYLFQRLRRLGDPSLNRRLVTLAGDTNTMRGTDVHLTEDGIALLSGKGNAVEWNGIDDWVGGVHLDSSAGRVWFHKDRTLLRA